MKIYQRIFLVGLLIAPISVLAVDLTEDISLILPSTGEAYILNSASTFDSLEISNGSLSFSLSAGQSVRLSSSLKRPLTNNQSMSTNCLTDRSEVYRNLASGSAAETFTVTPGTGTCDGSDTTPPGSGSPSIGGGGGGGGSSAPSIPSQTPASPSGASVAQKTLIEQLQSQIAVLMAQIAALKGVPSLPQQASPVAGIARTLAFGTKGSDVTLLQAFLAEDQSVYPEGKITGYFGRLTSAAVKRFQKKHGIDQVGIVGPKTRAKLNALMAQ